MLNRAVVIILSTLLLTILTGCSQRESARDQAAMAIYNNDPKLLGQIVSSNKSVLAETDGFDGSTLLHNALVNEPLLDCAQVLIRYGTDVNKADKTGKTPLHVLCEFSANPKAIQLLLTNGVELNSRDLSGRTPLSYAKSGARSEEAIRLLEQAGAKE